MVCVKAKLSADIHAQPTAQAAIQLATELVSVKVVLDVNSIKNVRGLIADRTIDVVRKLKIVANLHPAETVASHHADPTIARSYERSSSAAITVATVIPKTKLGRQAMFWRAVIRVGCPTSTHQTKAAQIRFDTLKANIASQPHAGRSSIVGIGAIDDAKQVAGGERPGTVRIKVFLSYEGIHDTIKPAPQVRISLSVSGFQLKQRRFFIASHTQTACQLKNHC
jgi:hypothetical protein